MNANGFLDPNGAGNGGLLAGYTMSNGTAYGDHFSAYAYKRIELHEDNLFYIKDALSPVSEDCTDAAEFTPALIVDGKKIMDDYWTGEQPRACFGTGDQGVYILIIEGRYPAPAQVYAGHQPRRRFERHAVVRRRVCHAVVVLPSALHRRPSPAERMGL